jgi:hypothetical protein
MLAAAGAQGVILDCTEIELLVGAEDSPIRSSVPRECTWGRSQRRAERRADRMTRRWSRSSTAFTKPWTRGARHDLPRPRAHPWSRDVTVG